MQPSSEAELSEAVAGLDAPVEIRGGGTRLALGRPVQAAETLSTAGLSGIRLYEPGALTLVAGAGTPLSEIEAALAAEGQRLAFEPMDHRPLLGGEGEPTLGGVVAGNISGPRRIQAGACRDSLIGVRLIDGQGRIIKNGGRVMKNVTGYDLVKLMAGSWGTLGILTELAFKVAPMPEAAAQLALRGLDDARAVAAMTAAMTSPFDPTGAAHLPDAEGGPLTLIRLEGFAPAVAYRAGRLRETLARFGEAEVQDDPATVTQTWAALRDLRSFADRPGAVWKISVPPSHGPEVVAETAPEAALYDWGGGLVWLLVPEGEDAQAEAIRAAAARHRGHATLVRASAPVRAAVGAFHPEPAPLAALSEGVRAKFDPRGVLNPGRMRG
ncbi:MAG: glycolate oxidase subunit GlcE [Pseudomonadota bacterium]